MDSIATEEADAEEAVAEADATVEDAETAVEVAVEEIPAQSPKQPSQPQSRLWLINQRMGINSLRR
jgi:hypothetical protein